MPPILRRRHQNVDAAEAAGHGGRESLEIGPSRHVPLDSQHPGGGPRGQFVEPSAVVAEGDDFRPLAQKPLDDGPAQLPVSPGHDGHLIQQTLRHG